MPEIKYEITEHLGVISETARGWTREVNMISWNGREPKVDVRDWSPEHDKMSKGITFTKEELQELAKIARKHAEEGRVAIRNIRRDANDALKKNKELPEDEVKKQQDEIQKATDKAIARIDSLLAEKEADILKV